MRRTRFVGFVGAFSLLTGLVVNSGSASAAPPAQAPVAASAAKPAAAASKQSTHTTPAPGLHPGAGQFVPVAESSVGTATLAAGASTTVTVAGANGVPAAAQVLAVAVTVTATAPAGSGYLQVYTAGTTRSTVDRTLPFAAGSNAEAYEVVKPSSAGQISVYASAATGVSVHLRGYYTSASAASAGGTFVPLATPATVVNAVSLGANATTTATFAGANGLPAASQISAVAVSVVADAPGAAGCVSAYPAGGSAADSSVCFPSAVKSAGFDTITLSSAGAATFKSTAATTLTVRVRGYYQVPTATAAGATYVPVSPAAVINAAALGAGGTGTATLAGANGIPAAASVAAVALNDSAASASAAGCLTFYPAGTTRPGDSTTCYASGGGSGDFDVTGLSSTGAVTAYTSAASSVTALVRGYFAKATAPGAPTGVAGTSGNGQASVAWTAPASDGGATITGYTVTASPGGATATTTGATSAIVKGLTNGSPYTFTVTASNAVGAGSASAASAAVVPLSPEVTYGHDDLGRMTAVFDSTGAGSKISYDEVGNITGIVSLPAASVAVAQISPERAPVGASVDVYGTGFGTDPTAITVSFNGAKVSPTAANLHRNRLTVAVPSGATTGPVTLTVAGTSSAYSGFTVSATVLPSAAGLSTSLVNSGDPVTLTGTGFNPDPTLDVLSINGTVTHADSATATSITYTTPPTHSFGHVTVETPAGKSTTSADVVSVPAPFATTDVAWEGRIKNDGTGSVISFPQTQKIGLALFDVAAGQRAMVSFTNATLADCYEIHVWGPNETVGDHSESVCGDTYFDLPDSTVPGTYEVEIQPASTDTGTVTVAATTAADPTAGITIGGGAKSLTTTVPGQHAVYTFTGTAGQRVFTTITTGANTTDFANARIVGPAGVVLASTTSQLSYISGSSGYIDTATLPATGTYQVIVDPETTGTGTWQTQVSAVPTDVTVSGSIGGGPVSFPLTTLGQNGVLTFSGTAGTKIFTRVSVANATVSGGCVSLQLNDAATNDIADSCTTGATGYLDDITLPATTAYTLQVDPQGLQTANVTVNVLSVPADANVSAAADGTTRSAAITYGQGADYTFAATAGQRVLVTSGVSGVVSSNVKTTLLAPDGSSVTAQYGGLIGTTTLATAGTYTVVVKPDGDAIGTTSATIYNVPADVTQTLTPNGAAATATTTAVGQGADFTFPVTSGQTISISCSDNLANNTAGDDPALTLLDPSGNTVSSNGYGCTTATSTVFTAVATATGTYKVTAVLPGVSTGSITLQLFASAYATATATVDGPQVSITTAIAGQKAQIKFTTTAANQTVYVIGAASFTSASGGYTTAELLDTSGSSLSSKVLFSGDPASTWFEPITLATAGTYVIQINPPGDATGTFKAQVFGSFVTAAAAVDGAQVSVSTTVAGQKARISFTTSVANQTVYVVGAPSFTSASGGYTQAFLYDSSGGEVQSRVIFSGDAPSTWFGPLTLAAAGTYTIQIEPPGDATGTFKAQVFGSFVTAPAALDGTQVSVTTTKPGQEARIAFTTTGANQTVYVVGAPSFTSASGGYTQAFLYDSSGNELQSKAIFPGDAPSTWFEPLTLATAGTYTVQIEPPGDATGTYKAQVFGSFATAIATVNGAQVSTTTTTPGEEARISFTGTANHTIYVTGSSTATDANDDYTWYYLFDSSGNELSSALTNTTGAANLFGAQTLSASGTYFVQIAAPVTLTGTFTVKVSTTAPTAAVHRAVQRPRSTTPSPSALARAAATRSRLLDAANATPADEAKPKPNPEPWPPTTGAPLWSKQPTPADNDARLTGRILTTDGKPLSGVTVSILGGVGTTDVTDHDGRFSLHKLPQGTRVLRMDGRTASHGHATYGVFDVQVHLKQGTNTLFYTPYLPVLDTAHEIDIPSPTTKEVVLTNPGIPGLEVHIPAGVTVLDADGKPVHRLGITPIPVARTPIPMPQGVQVPVYYTVQPAGGHLVGGSAWIEYPNYLHQKPGTPVNFWHYEKHGEGWEVYGGGTVTADGTQVHPDKGTYIEDFDGAMINVPGWLKSLLHGLGDALNFAGDPVDLQTGLFQMQQTDLTVNDVMPLELTRAYNGGDSYERPFGYGQNDLYDTFLSSQNQYQEADLNFTDGSTVHYTRTTPGNCYCTAAFAASTTTTRFAGSSMVWNGAGWNLRLTDGTVLVYGENAPLQKIIDPNGNTVLILRANKGAFGNYIGDITDVRSPNGYWLHYTYDTSDRITQVQDSGGRTVKYTYDTTSGNGHLQTVTDPAGGVTTYAYDTNGRLSTITDARQNLYLTNTYDANGRVHTQALNTGVTYTFAYALDSNNNVTATTVTDNTGHQHKVTFDANGRMATDQQSIGTPLQHTVSVTRDPTTQLPTQVSDTLGRTVTSSYDASGQIRADTAAPGTANSISDSATYNNTPYGLPDTIKDPRGYSSSVTYDGAGNVRSVTDPLNHTTTATYNTQGQLLTTTDPAKTATATVTYDRGEPDSTTDALGRTTRYFRDAVGRVVIVTAPDGSSTQTVFSSTNLVLKTIDAHGNATVYTYDPNGNLKSVTDARQEKSGTPQSTSYVYDPADRISTRTDPLGNTDSYTYDAAGRMATHTDRNGKVTAYGYDTAGRLSTVGYGRTGTAPAYSYESTLTDAYDDTTGRLSTVTDSTTGAGVLTYGYDALDRVISEQASNGTVSYGYDEAGNLTTLTPNVGAKTVYAYSPTGRLATVTQGSQQAVYTYDTDDRVSSETLPNGVVATPTYDIAGQLSSLTYAKGSTTLGNLVYTYDAAGRVNSVTGTLAAVSLPAPETGETYDAANRLTAVGSTTYTYDNAGNLTSDGATSYTWNSRGQLIATTGINPSTLTYDPAGRLATSTAGGVTTTYRYSDQQQIGQSQSNGATLSYLVGPGIDNVISATDNTGATADYLRDPLGSTLALTDTTGAITSTYSYDPFGKTTSSTGDTNPMRYTALPSGPGLPSGLQYNRARFYSPGQHRFISQDPIGFSGGTGDLYQYANADPVDNTDPSGEFVQLLAACGIGGLINDFGGWLAGKKHSLGDYIKGGARGCAMGVLTALDPEMLMVTDESLAGEFLAGEESAAVDAGLGSADGELSAGESGLADDGAGESAGAACAANSFAGATPVLMADGTRKPIDQVKVGDQVANAQPGAAAGTADQKHTVTAVHITYTDHEFTDVTVAQAPVSADSGPLASLDGLRERSLSAAAPTATVTGTAEHLYWDATTHVWTPADRLRAGDLLQTTDGRDVSIIAVRTYTATLTTYNLTVDGLHTYYVEAGGTPVLVHNCITVTSVISDDSLLVKAAQKAGSNQRVQQELDSLQAQLSAGNMNPGIGTKALAGTDVFYARGANGARLFFRNVDGGIQIVGKADKGNESQVINRLMQLYGQ